jgi:hypothetical protein
VLRGAAGNRETLDLTMFWPQRSAQKRELFRDATKTGGKRFHWRTF